jgi:uncharacterized membrane protein YczE
VRSASLVGGLFLFAVGIVALLESDLGLSPWDCLNQGIQHHTPLSFGAANVVIGLLVLCVAWALGQAPGIGTVANAVLIGVFIELLLAVPAIDDLDGQPLAVRIGLLAFGLVLFGVGTGFYIGAAMGAGPRDSLMLVMSHRTGARIGIALGGTFGVGTIAFAVLIGPIVETSFALLERTPLAVPAPGGTEIVEGI